VVEIKTLLILRHAKAQPDAPAGDHLRALTDRGRRDATTIGDHLHALVATPDGFVTSDARRALQTAELAAAACDFAKPLTIEPAIYGADAAELAEIVRRLPDASACVVIVGHNPGLQDLVDLLSGDDGVIDHLPTAGLAYLEHDATRWRDLADGTCRFRGMTSPRLLAART
jgi:phosphohistidine phosphatase